MVLIPACVALLVNARSKNGSAGGTSTASSPANMTAIDTAKKAQSKPKGPAFVPDGVTEVEKTINGRHVLCLFPRYRAPYGRAMSPGEAAGAMQQAIFEADRLTKRKLQAEESGQYDEVQIQGQ
jgi:hypothetical protein